MRTAEIIRNTNETKIRVAINLDGTGRQKLDTGVPFLDHMLDQIARHGLIDLEVHAQGDPACSFMCPSPVPVWVILTLTSPLNFFKVWSTMRC